MTRRVLIISFVLLFILSPFSLSFSSGRIIKAETVIDYQEISADTTWTLANSPYIIMNSELLIDKGKTLTIEPGVIVKLWQSRITIDGKIIAQGNTDNQIIFTSVNDDQRGGKTKNFSSTGTPTPGDWINFAVDPGGELTLNNTIINYGGISRYYQCKSNSIIKQNTALAIDNINPIISVFGGRVDINNSEISHNTKGIEANNGFSYTDDQGNQQSGASQVTIQNSKIFNNPQGGVINNGTSQIDATNNWWGDDSGPYNAAWNAYGLGDSVSNNVLFDPWVGKPVEPIKNPVILVPGILGSWNVTGTWELDPILHTYDNLWQALQNAGYEVDKTLFAFPYQWRLANSYTASLLKDKIQEVKNICQQTASSDYDCSKVDIVAHSMGGLVARAYVESNDYNHDVDQLIFLATPHQGASNAYLMWEGGEFGPAPLDKLFQRILTVEADFNGYAGLFEYIRNLPVVSIQELLPVYDYLRDKDSGNLRKYPNNYPVNNFLEQLNNPLELAKLSNVKITNIIGEQGDESTISNLRVVDERSSSGEWENGYPENYSTLFTDHGLEYGQGDGTVPARSDLNFNGMSNVIIKSDHLGIVTDAQKQVIKELTGTEPSEEVRDNMIKQILLVRIFSPANFIVIAPDGQKVGKSFTSNQDVNEIAGGFYSGSDGPQFAVVPNPVIGEYKIKLQGTGSGEYKLSTSLVGDDSALDTGAIDQEYTGQIRQNQQQEFNINYDVDNSGGNLLTNLSPVITSLPMINIASPLASSTYLHSQSFKIAYTALNDDNSHASSSVYFDNQRLSTSTIDLFYTSLGRHTVKIVATNKIGTSSAEVEINVITTIDDTIKDVDRTGDLGWFAKEKFEKKAIINLSVIEARLQIIQKEIKDLGELKEKINKQTTLTDKINNLLIKIVGSVLGKSEQALAKTIQTDFGNLAKDINSYFKTNKINQLGYDIIINDINYLKNNL